MVGFILSECVKNRDMERTNICGLSRNELTAAGLSRPVTTMDAIKLEARHLNSRIVIECVGHGWIVVMPGGAVIGTHTPLSAFEAEHTAWEMGEDEYQVIVDRMVGR